MKTIKERFMKRKNLILALIAMIIMLAACNGNTPGPSDPEIKPLDKVPADLYGEYRLDDVTLVLDEMSIKMNETELAQASGVVEYVNGVLAERNSGLAGLTIKEDTVSYETDDSSIVISFGGLESDEGYEPGTGTLTFEKDAEGFHFTFAAETVLNDYRVADAFHYDIPSEDTPIPPEVPEEPVESEFTEVQEALYGTYTYDTVITIAEGSIIVDGVEVTTPAGVAEYVNKTLGGGLTGLTIDEGTVRHIYTADSAIITFGGLESDEDYAPGTGSMNFKKAGDTFYYTFEAQTVINGTRVSDSFSVAYGPESQS